MSLNRSGPPAAEPLTVEQAKLHLRETLDDDPDDDEIAELIAAARELCERRIDRTLISTPWTLALDTFPTAIMLEMPPIIEVQSLQYIDEDGVTRTLDPQDYQVDTHRKPGWIVPAPDVVWPTTQRGRINAVTVNYTAGHGATAADVPTPLVRWIKLALTEMYINRSRSGTKPQLPHDFADGILRAGYQVWTV